MKQQINSIITKDFDEALRILKSNKINQSEVGAALALSREQISRIKTGHHALTEANRKEFNRSFGHIVSISPIKKSIMNTGLESCLQTLETLDITRVEVAKYLGISMADLDLYAKDVTKMPIKLIDSFNKRYVYYCGVFPEIGEKEKRFYSESEEKYATSHHEIEDLKRRLIAKENEVDELKDMINQLKDHIQVQKDLLAIYQAEQKKDKPKEPVHSVAKKAANGDTV